MATAKFDQTCANPQCGKPVRTGMPVRFTKEGGKFRLVACPACDPSLATAALEPPKPPMEIRVRVAWVKFAKDTFSIAQAILETCSAHDDSPVLAGQEFAIVGKLGTLQPGDQLDLKGVFEKDARFGWQFNAKFAVPVVAGTDQALCRFLAKFPQVGPRRAEQILQTLGGREGVLQALEHNHHALTRVQGITEARAKEIADAYRATSTLKDAMLFLAEMDLGEVLTAKLIDEYGEDAQVAITDDPYVIMELPGIGFQTADKIAKKLGVKQDDPRRIAAAVLHMFDTVEDQGHTWATTGDVLYL